MNTKPPALIDRAGIEPALAILSQLKPESPARWGRLDAHGLLAHIEAVFHANLFNDGVEIVGNPAMRLPGVRWVIFEVLPWPKGGIKVPDKFTPPPVGSFEETYTKAEAAMRAFVELLESEPSRKVIHPAFGPHTMRTWSRMHAIHLKHHFRQFGLI